MAKAPRKKRKLIKTSEFANQQRMKQDGGVVIQPADFDHSGDVVQVRHRAVITCKLDWYLHAGSITKPMWEAGDRFALYHFQAGKLPRTTPLYADFVQGRRGDAAESKMDAHDRLRDALKHLEPLEADVIWDVCGNDLYAGNPGRTRALREGLRALAVHWGIVAERADKKKVPNVTEFA